MCIFSLRVGSGDGFAFSMGRDGIVGWLLFPVVVTHTGVTSKRFIYAK